MSRLRIAYWSPLNPCRSGISDYSENLLFHLAQYADIDIYVDGYTPTNEFIVDKFAVYDYKSYSTLALEQGYDVNLYQMGNSPYHEYIYETLLTEPGVVVLHEYILQGFMYHIAEAQGGHRCYLDEVEYSEGKQARKVVEQELREGKVDIFTYPLNKRIVETSLGIVVHSHWMRSQLRKQGAHKPIAVIPHGANLLTVNQAQKTQLRAKLGLDPQALVISCFGYVMPTKRANIIVRAFSRFHTAFPRSVLLLVGGIDEDMEDYLDYLISLYQLNECLRVTGYMPNQIFEEYLRITDICINLRFPTVGETSGTLYRALGSGLPVLASDLPQFSEIPEDCTWKVSAGKNEEESELVAYLLDLASHPSVRHQMGRCAQSYIANSARWAKVAGQYKNFLHQITTYGNTKKEFDA
jgi:glycosyltransferase involved in cell wall biosynthesis